jgi:hypothetical protein
MSGLATLGERLRAWFSGHRAAAPACCSPQVVEQAIEQVVEGVDPRLRAVPRYRKRLAPAVAHTLEYFTECGAWLAAPVEFSARAWSADPLVRTLFATVNDLQRFFSAFRGLREFFRARPDCREALVGLGVTRLERKGVGLALSGELIQREVPQRVLSFADYRLFGASASEAELRRHIEQRGFRFLIGQALERIVEQAAGQPGGHQGASLLRLRLHGLQEKRHAMDSLYAPDSALDNEITQLCARLRHERAATGGESFPLERELDAVAEVLGRAEHYVSRETVRLRVNRMNVLVGSPDEPADELVLSEVTIGNRPPRVVVLVRYPRAELLPESMNLDRAQNALGRQGS